MRRREPTKRARRLMTALIIVCIAVLAVIVTWVAVKNFSVYDDLLEETNEQYDLLEESN